MATSTGREIMSADRMRLSWGRVAHALLELNGGTEGLTLVGIPTRGEPLAERLAILIHEYEGVTVPVHKLETRSYRDDQPEKTRPIQPPPMNQGIPVEGQKVVIVDDVMNTGRTVRAAMDAITHIGQPSKIWVVVLIDTENQDYPIRPTIVGGYYVTKEGQRIAVRLVEADDIDEVLLLES